jgi:hypothetical protein
MGRDVGYLGFSNTPLLHYSITPLPHYPITPLLHYSKTYPVKDAISLPNYTLFDIDGFVNYFVVTFHHL